MPLKITLKPHERMIVGGAVITNGNTRCDLLIENKVSILRQKDIMSEKDADSPCRKIYFTIQNKVLYCTIEDYKGHLNG